MKRFMYLSIGVFFLSLAILVLKLVAEFANWGAR